VHTEVYYSYSRLHPWICLQPVFTAVW